MLALEVDSCGFGTVNVRCAYNGLGSHIFLNPANDSHQHILVRVKARNTLCLIANEGRTWATSTVCHARYTEESVKLV
ncbi:uncharacterized protein CTRU02_205227 [Colletotrichum truncatum]|uniref:Uncharacterized protein n=1 Tax=Colletotrichum truncatum TaxID=5467 RepID=A0ACC3Z3E1_COLTU|nr:uncharacterized protein CTRU02_04284 [Colletotrichum truncatum]KAF6795474.1 hypothetical protein CTRU02_04284 [Colletotrichum truncatum]